ncbi:hypothetical protein [Pseudoglutamicibacter cumminsii]|uniref:hypothetical protein n=1 Tax=Pseudoglutamicibacter cumminsii TaxID=156979 RepID=UPI0021A2FCB1|nr:hypothetical protein [Pseudoglutamicibacter cumminsii]MCT1685479.1 hypothetical protein [Pseudoglutamicibacter cumminsii]
MAWFKVDDNFYDHPKVDSLTLEAVGVWLLCGTYAARHLTDGHIATRRAYRMGATEDTISELVEAGLWVETLGGYQFHEWDLYQPTRAAVEAERAKARERQQKRRRARDEAGRYTSEDDNETKPVTDVSRRSSGDVTAMSQRDTSVTHGDVTEKFGRCHTSPDPTRPDPARPPKNTPTPTAPTDTTTPQKPKPKPRTYPDDFETFWDAYPRRTAKADAYKAWKAATKRATPETITTAAARYAADPNLPDPQYIPYPATWLRSDSWDNPPEPQRGDLTPTQRRLQATLTHGLTWAAQDPHDPHELTQENPPWQITA